MIYNERDMRAETVKRLAEAVMVAARTAPKAKGRDLVEIAMLTDEDVERLSDMMLKVSQETGLKFLLRDAANILQSQALLLIGTRNVAEVCALNCGYCGFSTCSAKPDYVPCAMNAIDVGIAVGAACSKIADYRLDSRVLFSAGWVAKRMGVLSECDLVFAIPLSSSSKSPFFDRISPVKKQ